MFVLCLTLLSSSHKADVDWLLAEAQTERVQKLLGMPVRDVPAQNEAGGGTGAADSLRTRSQESGF